MDKFYDIVVKIGFDGFLKIFLFVFGAAGWLIAFTIKRSYDKKNKRLDVYNDVLTKFEKINQYFSGVQTKDFAKASTELSISVINDPDNLIVHITKYFNEMNSILENSMNTVNEIYLQFAKFRLVASSETITLFDQFKKDSLSLINETYEMQKQLAGSFSDLTILEEYKNDLAANLEKKGISLIELYNKLEKQMKKDVGFN